MKTTLGGAMDTTVKRPMRLDAVMGELVVMETVVVEAMDTKESKRERRAKPRAVVRPIRIRVGVRPIIPTVRRRLNRVALRSHALRIRDVVTELQFLRGH